MLLPRTACPHSCSPVPLSRMVTPYAVPSGRQGFEGTVHIMPVTNMLERLNEEIKRRTHVVRIFPNTDSCLRLIRALCVETHEGWLEDNRYLNMTLLAEQK